MPYIIHAPKDARITMTGDAERLFYLPAFS